MNINALRLGFSHTRRLCSCKIYPSNGLSRSLKLFSLYLTLAWNSKSRKEASSGGLISVPISSYDSIIPFFNVMKSVIFVDWLSVTRISYFPTNCISLKRFKTCIYCLDLNNTSSQSFFQILLLNLAENVTILILNHYNWSFERYYNYWIITKHWYIFCFGLTSSHVLSVF